VDACLSHDCSALMCSNSQLIQAKSKQIMLALVYFVHRHPQCSVSVVASGDL